MTVHATRKAFNFQRWIAENQHLLKPPVGNKQLFDAHTDMTVMIVGLDQLHERAQVAPAVPPRAIRPARRPHAVILEHAAGHHEPARVAVAPVRQDDYLMGVFWSCTISHWSPRCSKTSVR